MLSEYYAKMPPIRINVECGGQLLAQISVKPFEQIGASMDRELQLEGSEQTVKEAWLGQTKLDICGGWEPQGVRDEALLFAVLRNTVLRGHTGTVTAVAVLPNGGVVTGSHDKTAIIWSAEGEQEQVLCGHTDNIRAVAVMPNGDIVTGSNDETAIIWSVDGKQKQVLQWVGSVSSIAVQPNGDIVTGHWLLFEVVIWGAEGVRKHVMRGHTGAVTSVAAMPNGDIVTGSWDNTAIIWSAEGEQKRVLCGHNQWVMSVAAMPNGDIVTGSRDKTAIIWSAEGEQKRVLRGHSNWIYAVAVLPNRPQSLERLDTGLLRDGSSEAQG